LALKLSIDNLYAGYGPLKVLRGVTLEVGGGDAVVLLGTNGNGKSTLLKCILGFIRPESGSIVWEQDGERLNLVGRRPHEIVGLGISMIPEGRRLFPKLTVEENLLLGAFRSAARAELKQNLNFCYEVFPILLERRGQLAGSMSGGQQQMVAIARSLMSSPRLLLVDEPSAGLAPLLVTQTISKIGELKASKGLTVLMAEQNFNEAVRIADRGYMIVHGEIVFEGKTVAELENNELIKNYYLGV
jgi:branched-chain amino acid transport system ATP-binding protein